jgi:hypothetical protein
VLAPELQTIRVQEVRWAHQPDRVGRGVSTDHRGCRRGFVWHGKLLAYLPIIIRQDMAHGASHKIGTFMVRPVMIVLQQLSGHVHGIRSRLGLGQHCTEEGRVPPGVYPMLLQQKKHHPEGRRQIHHHVLQERT